MPPRSGHKENNPAVRKNRKATGDLKGLASVLMAVAHPFRLTILRHLVSGVKCVKDLNDLIPTSQPNLSQHMAALRGAGLVGSQSNGPLRCYYVLRPSLVKGLLALHSGDHPVKERGRESVIRELERLRRKRR
jgi:ArsR family transcriptional regulator